MADKPPAEKLPLAVRKNVRDGWEAKKPAFETQLEELLGQKWTFDINPLAIFPYAEPGSYGHNSLGDCINAYIEGFIYQLKRYLETTKDAGKTELNTVVPTHSITLLAADGVSYGGVDVHAGVLRLKFGPTYLGTNVDSTASELAHAVSSAPQPEGAPKLSFAARHAIAKDYDAQIKPVLEKARAQLKNPKLEFKPGFEGLGKALKEGKDVRDDWESNLGDFAVKYFESFLSVLESEKFGEDEMLREGFEEGVPKGVVELRIVGRDVLKSGYNGLVLEDGKLVILTIPEYWGTNIHYAGQGLVDIL